MDRVIKVEGMMCRHCASRVEKALRSIDGVETVRVELENKTAYVSVDDVSDEALRNIIVEAGYEVTSIE